MTEPTRPTPARTLARENWYYVPAGGFADPANPTALELSAASVLDFTLMAFDGGTTRPTQSTNRVQEERRLGDDVNYESKGLTTYQGGTITYAVDPQAVAASEGKMAWETFQAGPDGGYLVNRMNVPRGTAPTAGQFVSVWPSDVGPSILGKAGDGESAQSAGTCDYFITAPPTQMVALA